MTVRARLRRRERESETRAHRVSRGAPRQRRHADIAGHLAVERLGGELGHTDDASALRLLRDQHQRAAWLHLPRASREQPPPEAQPGGLRERQAVVGDEGAVDLLERRPQLLHLLLTELRLCERERVLVEALE
eukprot:scaffold111722_cov75-Phaeocystis_antarctica.AAC.3